MNTAHSTPRAFLSGLGRSASDAPDPADMGTCFGLEMTLDQPAEVPHTPPETRPWWQRLGSGRKFTGA